MPLTVKYYFQMSLTGVIHLPGILYENHDNSHKTSNQARSFVELLYTFRDSRRRGLFIRSNVPSVTFCIQASLYTNLHSHSYLFNIGIKILFIFIKNLSTTEHDRSAKD